MHKLRVGVLMGGRSQEKEVSLNSGRTICDHLDTARYQIVPLFQMATGSLYILPWHFLYRGKISDFEHRLATQAESISWDTLRERIDFMFIAQHGRYAEDGILQGVLEIVRIPYLGSKTFASALGMDKAVQKVFLRTAGISVPRGIAILPPTIQHAASTIFALLQQHQIAFPCVVKPHREGSSLGVTIVERAENLIAALNKACYVNEKPQAVIVEEKIIGREFTCIVLTDYVNNTLLPLTPTEIIPEEKTLLFDYEQKYMPGRAMKCTPARFAPEILQQIQETCCNVMQVLGLTNVGRIDGIVAEDNTIFIIDPNTFCGMSPSSFAFMQAAQHNMSTTGFINHLIETELYAYGLQKNNDNDAIENTIMQQTKLRVAVLMGGRSNEREISLESGRNMYYKLSPHKYAAQALLVNKDLELFALDQKKLVLNSTKEIEAALTPADRIAWSSLPHSFDFVLIGLHGGEGENGCVQGMLEMLDVPYNGSSVLTSALCMDKYKTNQFLQAQGFVTPRGILVNHDMENVADVAQLPWPLIVKPHDDGCSVLVHKVHNDQELQTALNAIFVAGKEYALVEECIRGMELTVGCMGNDDPLVLPPSRAIAAADILSIEEKFLPGAGENQTPAPLPTDVLLFVQETIKNAYLVLNCRGYARIDCFYQAPHESPTGEQRLIILEVNTLPGMTPATVLFHQAAEIGIKPMEFIDRIIEYGLQEHGKGKVVGVQHPYKETRGIPNA